MLRRYFNASTIIAIVALVFAMTGGAYAAKHYLITSTKQISPKVLKALKGKQGPAGPEGKQGPAGPQGPAGANGKDGINGKDGLNGKNGTNGTNGTNGESVTIAQLQKGNPNCAEGGAEFSNKTGTGYACNGGVGSGGGSSECLASGKSEYGQYSLNAVINSENWKKNMYASVGFAIPLCAGKEVTPHFIAGGQATPSGCEGGLAEPGAQPGNLCVFEVIGKGFNPHEEEVEYCGAPVAKVAFNPVSFLSMETGNGTVKRSGTEVVFKDTEELKNEAGECGKGVNGHALDTGDWVVTAP